MLATPSSAVRHLIDAPINLLLMKGTRQPSGVKAKGQHQDPSGTVFGQRPGRGKLQPHGYHKLETQTRRVGSSPQAICHPLTMLKFHGQGIYPRLLDVRHKLAIAVALKPPQSQRGKRRLRSSDSAAG
jgi:hypothetical protein